MSLQSGTGLLPSEVSYFEMPQGPVFIAMNQGSLLAFRIVKEGFGVAGNDLNIGADILMAVGPNNDFADVSGKYFDNDGNCIASPHVAALDAGHAADAMKALNEICKTHIA